MSRLASLTLSTEPASTAPDRLTETVGLSLNALDQSVCLFVRAELYISKPTHLEKAPPHSALQSPNPSSPEGLVFFFFFTGAKRLSAGALRTPSSLAETSQLSVVRMQLPQRLPLIC